MQDVIEKFKAVENTIKNKPWFKKGKWIVSVHGFPQKNPDCVTFHLFKKHWFNESKQGIHIETFLRIEPKKRKDSSITVHLLREDFIPGTKIKRIELSKLVVDKVRHEIASWDGYKFRAGAYGLQPFTKKLDGSHKDFEKKLTIELHRLAETLGDVIDTSLKIHLKKI